MLCRGMSLFASIQRLRRVVLEAAQLPPTGDGQDGGLRRSPCHLVVSIYYTSNETHLNIVPVTSVFG